MPRKSRASRAAPRDATFGENIFDHFAKTGRSAEAYQEPDRKPAEPTMADLLKRMDALAEENKSYRATIENLSSAPASGQTPQRIQHIDPKLLDVNLDGLPDQVSDPKEYAAELQRRLNAVAKLRDQDSENRRQEAASINQQSADLWEGFKTSHEDWAEYPDLVASVSRQLCQEVEARGGDPRRYTTVTREKFFQDINKRLTEKYGRLIETEEPSEEDQLLEHGRRQGAGKGDEDRDGRTDGIFGGLESGGRPTGGDRGQRKGDMITDLQDVQKASGFF